MKNLCRFSVYFALILSIIAFAACDGDSRTTNDIDETQAAPFSEGELEEIRASGKVDEKVIEALKTQEWVRVMISFDIPEAGGKLTESLLKSPEAQESIRLTTDSILKEFSEDDLRVASRLKYMNAFSADINKDGLKKIIHQPKVLKVDLVGKVGVPSPIVYNITPTADKPVTIERSILIKFKGEQQVQIGFYNKAADTKYNVKPWIKSCKTARGAKVAADALPTIATVTYDFVEPGGTAGWNAIIRLPDIDVVEGASEADEYTGALVAGQHICKISIYGTGSAAEEADFTGSPLESDQFYLKVTE